MSHLTSIHLKSRNLLIRDALHYLRSIEPDVWHNISDIPWDIRTEVVRILTTGRVSVFGRKVFENETWTQFKLTER